MKLLSKGIVYIYLKLKVAFYKILSSNSPYLNRVKLVQATIFNGKGNIEIVGASLGMYSSPGVISGSSYIDARHPQSIVRILDGTIINNSATIIAEKSSINIGRDCLIGFNFQCLDSDFHPLDVKSRRKSGHLCKNVIVGDNVFIGNNVTILKGVTIGDNSVIGSCSVVTKDILKNSIYAGNPAKFIRELD